MSHRIVAPPTAMQPIVYDNGTMSEAFRNWTAQVNTGLPIVGEGSPEGVLNAPLYSFYWDSLGAPGAIQYGKMLSQIGGDTKKGWVLM